MTRYDTNATIRKPYRYDTNASIYNTNATIRKSTTHKEINMDEKQYQKAVNIIRAAKCVSTAFVQRQLEIGYNESARMIERMEKEGIISAVSDTGKREVL